MSREWDDYPSPLVYKLLVLHVEPLPLYQIMHSAGLNNKNIVIIVSIFNDSATMNNNPTYFLMGGRVFHVNIHGINNEFMHCVGSITPPKFPTSA